jgi:uncharacterized protein with PQ loop repeat
MESTVQSEKNTQKINRVGYIAFLVAAAYFLIRGDYSSAVTFSALAPIFDPFDPKVPYNKRTSFQKAVLVANLILTVICFALLLA